MLNKQYSLFQWCVKLMLGGGGEGGLYVFEFCIFLPFSDYDLFRHFMKHFLQSCVWCMS